MIHDDEFGDIIVSKRHNARYIRVRVAPNGSVAVSAPSFTPDTLIKRFIKSSRLQIREMISSSENETKSYQDGDTVGQSHRLSVREGTSSGVSVIGTQIIVSLRPGDELSDSKINEKLREAIIKVLRKEARAYLPGRLKKLAQDYNFSYKKVRLSHASSRWGSCSTLGTISLNIALMKLPHELIDYVLIHELAHTKHMNHSPEFWNEVSKYSSDYKALKTRLRQESPHI